MTDLPLISVVIPTYRKPVYLGQALDSIEAQTYQRREVVVVDDGSPAAGEINEIAGGRQGVRLIRQSHLGHSVARNVGIAAARGELVGFLDDDDVWAPRKLEMQVEALGGNGGSFGVYTGGWHMDAEGAHIGEDWSAPQVPSEMMIRGAVPLFRFTTALVRRDILLRYGGFNPSYPLAQDDDVALRLLQFGSFGAVDMPLCGYRRHASNVTRVRRREHRGIRIRIVMAQILAAEARGDHRATGWLRENLRRLKASLAGDVPGEVWRLLQDQCVREATAELAVGLRLDARVTVSTGVRRVMERRSRVTTGRSPR